MTRIDVPVSAVTSNQPSDDPTRSNPPLLEMLGMVKEFPGVRALRGVDLRLHQGEVLALLGENGAGKSSLMKILGGAQPADSGTIRMNGQPVQFRSPVESRRAGISIIYQEFNLVPGLSALENLFLGQERTSGGFLQRKQEAARGRDILGRIGAEFDHRLPCRSLSTAQQQLVEIGKALISDARLLVMDEPTAALTSHEVERLFQVIRDLKQRGLGVIYISHRLEEIAVIADRVSVLRDGQNAGEGAARELSRSQLIQMLVGRELKDEYPCRDITPGDVRLEVQKLTRSSMVNQVSLTVRAGEILALTGLVGAGRTEVARLIFGADRMDSGVICVDGNPVHIRSPRDAMAAGIGLLPEDRKLQGLVLKHSVRSNFGLPSLGRRSTCGWINQQEEHSQLEQLVSTLRIRIPGHEERAGNLSGGNQQKVVLAKWLGRNCDILIFDEPTRGIDVGARYEIYLLMHELASQGKAILMISSELPEVLGMADRVLVMHSGRVTGEILSPKTATQEQIMKLAIA